MDASQRNGGERQALPKRVYPEAEFGGFSCVDATVAFYVRVNSLLTAESVVLDIGCGRGEYAEDRVAFRRGQRIFRGKCRRVIGIDVDEVGRENPFLDEFHLIDGDTLWAIPEASIDLAVCDVVVEHLEHPDHFFRECQRTVKRGGYLCIRTPNALGYVSVISRMVPNRLHGRVVSWAQKNRPEKDVFPTRYRCNTKGALRRALTQHGFRAAVWRHVSEPNYLHFSALAYRVGAFAHRHTPDLLKPWLFAFAQRV